MWRPGIEHKVVDCFSRHPVEVPAEDDLAGEIEMEHTFRTLRMVRALDCDTGEHIIEDQRLKNLREECAKDGHYRNLIQVTTTGFPVKPDLLPPGVRPYWSIRDELTVDDGIVLWGARMIIPKAMRKEILQQLHASHQGQERTLRRARQIVYWPNISNDIRNTVRTCAACAGRLPSQPQEPLQQDERPSRPFESVASDLCHVAGKTFLVLVDRYSGWPIVSDCGRSATATVIIRLMKDAFTDKGVPVKLITDGGPQFSSREFKQFCGGWGITHVQSSPHYPQANGAAEAAVKSVKNLIIKSTNRGNVSVDSFREAIIEYRNTPREHGLSPSQMIYGRPMRSHVVTHYRTFKPEWQKRIKEVDKKATLLREKAKAYYDQRAHPLGKLDIGKIVRVQHPVTKRWSEVAEVVGQDQRGRSYIVKSEGGRVFWRNRRFLRLFSGSWSTWNMYGNLILCLVSQVVFRLSQLSCNSLRGGM